MDWRAWHRDYDDPSSPLSERRRCVQRHVRAALDRGARTVVSGCAGDGADVLDVLRPDDVVTGRLIELDPELAAVARAAAPSGIEVVTGDAGVSDRYAGAVPADLVLLCGVFGNLTDEDVMRIVASVPELCSPGGTVIWTRGRPKPEGHTPYGGHTDRTGTIRGWFADVGCTEVAWEAPGERSWSVGVHRFVGIPQPLIPGRTLFTFVR